MLNCIPCYENTKGQAEGSGFSEHTTDTIAKMHQRTNELFQGIISQILGIKYQDTFIWMYEFQPQKNFLFLTFSQAQKLLNFSNFPQ